MQTFPISDDINEYLYPAELAGLSYSISNTKYGINVSVGGYHDKQKALLEKIFTRFTEYKVDEDRFAILKEAYIRGLKNFKMEQPYSHASYHNNVLLAQRIWTKEELLASVENITASQIQPFISELFANIHIECCMFGNLTGTNFSNTNLVLISFFTWRFYTGLYIYLLQQNKPLTM